MNNSMFQNPTIALIKWFIQTHPAMTDPKHINPLLDELKYKVEIADYVLTDDRFRVHRGEGIKTCVKIDEKVLEDVVRQLISCGCGKTKGGE